MLVFLAPLFNNLCTISDVRTSFTPSKTFCVVPLARDNSPLLHNISMHERDSLCTAVWPSSSPLFDKSHARPSKTPSVQFRHNVLVLCALLFLHISILCSHTSLRKMDSIVLIHLKVSNSSLHINTQTSSRTDIIIPAGTTVARVRAIFALPEAYGLHFKHPVTYVEWFTSLRQLDPETGMFKISKSTRNHRRQASIIPITQIVQSCHLIPVWGKHVDPSWNAHNVLDRCSRFYVNPYLRHHDFVYLRYLQEQ